MSFACQVTPMGMFGTALAAAAYGAVNGSEDEATGHLSIDLKNLGAQTIGGGQGVDKLLGIENVVGGGFNDLFLGFHDENRLEGFGGDDKLRGRGGNDTLDVGDGNDHVTGHPVGRGRQRHTGWRDRQRCLRLPGW